MSRKWASGVQRLLAAGVSSLAAFGMSATAQTTPEYCTPVKTLVAYTNGVFQFDESNNTQVINYLQSYVSSKVTATDFQNYQFKVFANSSGCSRVTVLSINIGAVGCPVDLVELLMQRLTTGTLYAGMSVAARLQLVWMLLGDVADNVIQLRLSLTPDQLAAARTDYQAAIGAAQVNARTLSNQNNDSAAYNDVISRGGRVILLAHSQGNVFANSAYAQVPAANRAYMRVIGVASPDSAAPAGPYTTLTGDKIILLVPNSVAANLTDTCVTTLCHEILTQYLRAGSASRTAIEANISAALTGLSFPTALFSDGAITVTTSWNSEPDVDTHVYEPGGSHVYYAALHGTSGTLDHDDTDGFGPENYLVPCATLQVGAYRVGLNYYFGSGPAPVTMNIRAGNVSRTFNKTLTNVRGFNGDNSPEPVATITVSGTAPNYSFAIQ